MILKGKLDKLLERDRVISRNFLIIVIQYVNLYQQPGSSNLIVGKLEVGVAS